MSFKATLVTNTIYKVGNLAVLFLTTVLLTRAAGVEGFGLLSLLLLNCTFFNLFTSFGSDAGLGYAVAVNEGNVNRMISILAVFLPLQLVLLAVVEGAWFGATGRPLLFPGEPATGWWVSLLLVFAISMLEKMGAVLNGRRLFRLNSQTVFLCNLFSLLMIGYLYFVAGHREFRTYLFVFVFANVLPAIALVAAGYRWLRFSFDWRFSPASLRLFFTYSFFAFFTNCIQFLAYRVDLWLLAYFRNETELGWYVLAVRLAQLFWILPILFAGMLFPRISSEKERYDHNEMLSLLRVLNTVNVAAAVVVFALAPVFVRLLFGQSFKASVPALRLLLPGIVLFVNATILAAYFAGMNQLRTNLWGSVLCLLTVGVLDLLLIPKAGYNGAAVASSIGYTATGLYFILVYCRQTNCPVQRVLLPQKSDWAFLQRAGKKLFIKHA